jgi:CheY-like chemotaxis protein
MARLLDDLLDVARITQGKLGLRRQWVRPTELIDSAVEAVRPLIERKQHTLEVHLEANEPLLDVDPIRIAQVVGNLLTNSAKYTDTGGRITLTTRTQGDTFTVQVQDTGMGLAREALPGLFEMFSQQHGGSDQSEGGLGIGLSLVKGLVELHGGTVHAESEGLGRGSRFTVSLPLGRRPEEAAAVVSSAPADPNHRRILVADDNRDAAEALAMLLGHLGHEVRVVFDGHSALSMARTFQPDLAVLDIGMPRLDGYAVARALRDEPWAASLVLVAVTGWGDAQARKLAFESGFDEHLTKPLSPDELQQLLLR